LHRLLDHCGNSLLQLTTALGQQDNLIIESPPSTSFIAKLQNISGGFLGTGHVTGEPHLLLHIQQRLYLRIQIASNFHLGLGFEIATEKSNELDF
jgi:hypothetical protein